VRVKNVKGWERIHDCPKSIIDFNKSLNEGACLINIFKPGSRYFNIIKTSGKLNLDKPIKNYSKQELDFLLYSPKMY